MGGFGILIGVSVMALFLFDWHSTSYLLITVIMIV